MGKTKKSQNKANDIHLTSKASEADTFPSFSFRFYQGNISIPKCKNADFFKKYLERLKKLSETSWDEINKAGRHGLGYEHLTWEQLNVQKPASVTNEIKRLMVFRATGDNHAFLGFRSGSVFNVVFIETSFGDIYNHN